MRLVEVRLLRQDEETKVIAEVVTVVVGVDDHLVHGDVRLGVQVGGDGVVPLANCNQ